MINKKVWLILLLPILLFVSCQNKKKEETKNKIQDKAAEFKVFSDKSVEKVIEEFEKNLHLKIKTIIIQKLI